MNEQQHNHEGLVNAQKPQRPSRRLAPHHYGLAIALVYGSFVTGKGIGEQQIGGCKIAIAEQTAVVIDAALDRPGLDKEALEQQIQRPIQSVLNKYAELGYLVVDVSKDDQGGMTIAALPTTNAIDITDELSAAIKQASRVAK